MARQKKHEGFNPEAQRSEKRVFGNKFEFKSDLFKLEVAECNIDKSWNDVPNLEAVEHVHFFHTFDSDGRKMMRSNAVAGHFHVIEYTEQGDDKPVKITKVSGPMKEVKRRIKGKFVKVIEPVTASLEDDHTHKPTYRRTENVVARQISAQAVTIESIEANKTAPIQGVQIG
jgi:hypothetical protein